MYCPLVLELLKKTNPICTDRWSLAGRMFNDALLWLPPRATTEIYGLENLPSSPAIFCPNHTHKFDFLPLRAALLHHDLQLMTWIKARDYKHPAMRWILGKGGNIPLVSRGFLIATRFATVHRRKPTEDEYRALRAHVDEGATADPALLAPLGNASEIAGVELDPTLDFRSAIRRTYRELMGESLALARRGRDAGRHQHIYPQGATSKQLTPGHPGAVQAALALGVPIVPVAVSGCREVFVGKDHPLSRGGRIVIRIAPAMQVDPTVVPKDFVPFDPDHEDAHYDALQRETDRVMEVINAHCEPAYQWASDGKSDAKQGVARFYT